MHNRIIWVVEARYLFVEETWEPIPMYFLVDGEPFSGVETNKLRAERAAKRMQETHDARNKERTIEYRVSEYERTQHNE